MGRLRELAGTTPERFRTTCKWVPVDLWTSTDLEALRRGVAELESRIAPTERWRMTVEKRGEGAASTTALIADLAQLVPAPVDLTHPDKTLLLQLFADRAALSVLATSDVFSLVPVPWLGAARRTSAGSSSAGAARRALPAMPATVAALTASLAELGASLVGQVATAGSDGARPFRETVDVALELLGGTVPRWSVLADWNRWCVETGARFFVWEPSRRELSDRARAEALVHTIMMMFAREKAVRQYLASGVREAEIAMAGDDCVVCDPHRHQRIALDDGAAAALPPFHPGCRCGLRPHLG